MTWLALAPWQAWSLAAAAAAAAAWLFFLKLRHPRRAVPSLLLWQRALEQQHPQSAVERLRRLVSLLLTLAIALLLALAPGRPVAGDAGRPAVLTLVIDTAPSMAAKTSGGLTRLDRAKARARAMIAGAGVGARVRVIDTAGGAPPGGDVSPAEALRALDTLAVWPGPDRLPPLDAGWRDAVVITDGVRRRAWPAGAARVSVFEPAANVGISAFDVRHSPARPLGHDAFIEIVNASPHRRRTELTIRDATGVRLRRTLDLAPGERYRDAIDATGLARGEIRAAVATPGDVFSPDDEAVAYVAWDRPVRTLLVTGGNAPLETALRLDPVVDLTIVRPSSYGGDEGADVCVFDRFTPAREPAAPALLIGAPAADWLSRIAQVGGEVARPIVRAWDETQPVLRHVRGDDIRIDRALRLEPARETPGVRIVAAAETPLVMTADRPVRRVLVAFDLADTDFPYRLDFPLFLRNAIVWLAGVNEPIRAATGTVAAPWPDVEIVDAAGATVASRRLLDAIIFDAPAPAVYFARHAGGRTPIVVSHADPALSSVNASEFDGPAPDAAAPAPAGGELWPAMLALAFALAAVEWWTFHRRITV